MNLPLIDFAVLILLAFGAYRGFKKGFLVEIISLLGLFLSLLGAIVFLDLGVEHFKHYFEEYSKVLPYAVFIGIFVLLVIGFSSLAKLMKSVISVTFLGSLDRLVGAVFGVVKWLIGISLILWLSHDLGVDINLEEKSEIMKQIEGIAPKIMKLFLPYWPEVKRMFDEVSQLILLKTT